MTPHAKIPTGVDVHAPLATLHHAHGSILAQMDALRGLPALVEAMERARQVAAGTLLLFRGDVLQHHEDEEKALFPAVVAAAEPGPEREEVEAMVTRLRFEHHAIERAWQDLQPSLRLVAAGRAEHLDTSAVERLVDAYRAHAGLEEERFLPLAQAILGRDARREEALGLELHMRRLPDAGVGHI